MSSNVRFELNWQGLRELMKSDEMKTVLKSYAQSAKNIAGEGYEVSEYTGTNRANASIYAETKRARKDNLINNTLLKALGSVKD